VNKKARIAPGFFLTLSRARHSCMAIRAGSASAVKRTGVSQSALNQHCVVLVAVMAPDDVDGTAN
jgi:hypothetical protein